MASQELCSDWTDMCPNLGGVQALSSCPNPLNSAKASEVSWGGGAGS
jgi:hypothetical protein